MSHFTKSKRLLNKADYDRVYNQAKKWTNTEFIFLYSKNTADQARLGLAISKKMVPKAHERNRLKRLLRETFRKQPLSSFDVIVLAKRGVDKVSNSILISHLNEAWDKLKG